mgnify:FL=1
MYGLNAIGTGYSYPFYITQNQVGKNNMQNVERQNTATPSVEATAVAKQSAAQNTPLAQTQIPTLREGMDPAEFAVRSRIQYVDQEQDTQGVQTGKSAQEVMEEGECQTCKERKYQDGSDDPGVSFKTPTQITPEQAASAVRGHEQEHVVRERAKAQREDREVVSQSVTLHTAICPECGKAYISGGTTRTTTQGTNNNNMAELFQQQEPPTSTFEGIA